VFEIVFVGVEAELGVPLDVTCGVFVGVKEGVCVLLGVIAGVIVLEGVVRAVGVPV